MRYSKLVEFYDKLESTPSKLEKASIVSNLLGSINDEDIENVLSLLSGDIFPRKSASEMGVSTKLMMKVIATSGGYSGLDVERMFRDKGDLGLVAEKIAKSKKQKSLFRMELTTQKVLENLRGLTELTGSKSQKKKMDSIGELLNSSSPEEARYIVKTILGELRVGVADGIIKDSIRLTFLENDKDSKDVVEYAHNILNDFGEVTSIAKNAGVEGLKSVKVELGTPHNCMLGEAAESIPDLMDKFKCVIEPKLDGMRAQIHKNGNNVWVFTRSLENVTNQFPDIVELCKKSVTIKKCVLEAEVVAIDKKGNHLPFQSLSQRIQRKHKIDEMVENIPVEVNLFDITYYEGKMLFDEPFKKRREFLETAVDSTNRFKVIDQLVTEDKKKADKYYQQVIANKEEGVMVKNRDSVYVFGRKVNGWYKIKPILEPLDLVIIGATWGEGKRSNWLSSFVLGVRDQNTQEFIECGRMSTGLTEDQYDEITNRIRPLIKKEDGKNVEVKPEIVVEVGYQEIQQSPTYRSGYALRFPRLIRFRDDKSIKDADTTKRLQKIYKKQFK